MAVRPVIFMRIFAFSQLYGIDGVTTTAAKSAKICRLLARDLLSYTMEAAFAGCFRRSNQKPSFYGGHTIGEHSKR